MPHRNHPELNVSLPEFDWQNPAPTPTAFAAYLRFYGLLFPEAHQHNAGRIQCGGYDLLIQRWVPAEPRGTALLLHGYYDHTGLCGSLIQFCLQQQLQVFIVDLPGHGLSSGEQASIGSFQEYDAIFSLLVQQTQQYSALPLHVFAQSTGGAIVVNYLLKRQLKPAQSPFTSINLLAPLVRPWGWAQVKLLQPLLGPFIRQLKRPFHPNSSDKNFLRFVKNTDPLQSRFLNLRWVRALRHWVPFIEALPASDLSINIVQGDNDHTVAWPHNLKILQEKFPHQRLLMLPTAQHHLINENEQLRTQMFAQLAQWLRDDSLSSV